MNIHANAPNTSLLKEEFLRLAHSFFPLYFSESFFAKLEGGRWNSTAVEVIVLPPEEDQPVLISLLPQNFPKGLEAVVGTNVKEVSLSELTQLSIADICSIALKEDGTSLELNRKNGILDWFD